MENKKKILIIQHWSSLGGSGISLLNTCLSLNEEYDVTVYLPDNPIDLYNLLQSYNIRCIKVNFVPGQFAYYSGGTPIYRYIFWKDFIRGLLKLQFWARIFMDESPDLIILNSKVLSYLTLITKSYRTLIFVRETIPMKESYIGRFLSKYFLERANTVSFLSEYDMRTTGLLKAKTVVLPDFIFAKNYEIGLETSAIKERLNIQQKDFVLLYLGGVDKLKGYHILLKAILNLGNPNIKLIVCGTNNYTKPTFPRKILSKISFDLNILINHNNILKDNNLIDNVKFVGSIDNLSEYFMISNALVFPMTKPHQSRPAFECGLFKKPVIITDFACVNEYMIKGYNCLKFSNYNFKQLSNCINELANNKQLEVYLGENNFKMTMMFHDGSKVSKEIKTEISKMLLNNI